MSPSMICSSTGQEQPVIERSREHLGGDRQVHARLELSMFLGESDAVCRVSTSPRRRGTARPQLRRRLLSLIHAPSHRHAPCR